MTATLTVVGTGYSVAGHITPQIREAITRADHLFYLVVDGASGVALRGLNPTADSLADCYREGEDGLAASRRMVQRILAPLARGGSVCAAFYGHPAIFMHTSHAALQKARSAGHEAEMLPAVSAEDCLIADLGVDPAVHGRLLFEATDFILRPRRFETRSSLILLQIGVIGRRSYRAGIAPERHGLAVLAEVLSELYPASHPLVLYEAAVLPILEPTILPITLRDLPAAPVSVASTLYVPPLAIAEPDPAVRQRLGLAEEAPGRRQWAHR